MDYIVLYADDFDYDVWKEYCDICGVGYDATYIRFNFSNVESDD